MKSLLLGNLLDGSLHLRLKFNGLKLNSKESKSMPIDLPLKSKPPLLNKLKAISSLRNLKTLLIKPSLILKKKEPTMLKKKPREMKKTPFLMKLSLCSSIKSLLGLEDSDFYNL